MGESVEAQTWLDTYLVIWQDAVWHKSIHPIKPELMEDLATDPATAERLQKANYGAAAVGIPTLEDHISRAGSYVAVFNATDAQLRSAGHVISYAKLVQMQAIFAIMPRRIAGHNIPEWDGKPAGTPPAGMTERKRAVEMWLVPELETCAARAAWIFGWYKAACLSADVAENTREGSLLRSYSLRKAAEGNMPMYAEGMQAHRNYMREQRQAIDEGRVIAFHYTD
jgi:hypothetical protein